MDVIQRKIKGSTLVESIMAMTVVSVVIASAFTLYAQVVGSQKSVLKALGWSAFNQLYHEVSGDRNEGNPVSVESESLRAEWQQENYRGIPGIMHYHVTITDLSGTEIRSFDFIKREAP